MPVTTGQVLYQEVLNFLTPFIDKGDFKILNSPTDKYGKLGIIAGKLKWNVDKKMLKVFVGKSNGKFLFIPYEDRFSEQQCLMFVQKPLGKVIKIQRYIKVMSYKGKTSIELSQGNVDVHNYIVRLPKGRKMGKWFQIRDMLEVIDTNTNTISGLYATSEEGQKEIINMFPDFNRYDLDE